MSVLDKVGWDETSRETEKFSDSDSVRDKKVLSLRSNKKFSRFARNEEFSRFARPRLVGLIHSQARYETSSARVIELRSRMRSADS